MKRAWPYALVTLLAFVALILWLNLHEPDIYDHALADSPSGPLNALPPAWLPEKTELTECLLWARIEDTDGWYRLFWAGSDTYWFDDAAYFAGALVNPSAQNPTGAWTLKGEIEGQPFEVRYRLVEGEPPTGSMTIGPLTAPRGMAWFSRDYRTGRRTFSWALKE